MHNTIIISSEILYNIIVSDVLELHSPKTRVSPSSKCPYKSSYDMLCIYWQGGVIFLIKQHWSGSFLVIREAREHDLIAPSQKKMHGLDFDWLKLQDTVFYKDESCSVRKHTYSTFCTSLDPSWVSKLTSEGQWL